MENEDDVFFLAAYFTGHVQGVGFRYSVVQIAKGYEVTGFVKNLADGRVELEAEGQESECLQFLAAIQDDLDAYIRKTETSEGKRPRKWDLFKIFM